MEQINFPFITDPKAEIPPVQEELTLEHLKTLPREELESLYVEKIGRRRYFGRTDEEISEAILNPDGEIDRLREADRTDAWQDIGPTGK